MTNINAFVTDEHHTNIPPLWPQCPPPPSNRIKSISKYIAHGNPDCLGACRVVQEVFFLTLVGKQEVSAFRVVDPRAFEISHWGVLHKGTACLRSKVPNRVDVVMFCQRLRQNINVSGQYVHHACWHIRCFQDLEEPNKFVYVLWFQVTLKHQRLSQQRYYFYRLCCSSHTATKKRL